MAAPKKTKTRGNQPRVSKKTIAKKKEGMRDAIANNKKTSPGKKVGNFASKLKNEIVFGTKPTVLSKDKNVSPAYLAGYKAGLRQLNKKTDASLERRKQVRRTGRP